MSDLERAYGALTDKGEEYGRLFDYYDGFQPVVYSAKRLAEIFKNVDAVFTENWCAVVLDAVKDRVNFTGWESSDKKTSDLLGVLFSGSDVNLESDDVHEAMMVTGEAFFVAWPDETGQVQGFANDPRLCHAFYSPSNPRQMTFAAKWWVGDDDLVYMTLYYPDRLEYYQTKQTSDSVSSSAAFVPMEIPSAFNPYGVIPVFHFRLKRRVTLGFLKDVIPVQNGINKLLSDMMVAAEYGAFSQRWVISNADTVGKLKNAPNEIWNIPAGDGVGQQSSVGQFSPTDLNNYLQSIESLAGSLSAITRTPKHYFFQQSGDPSGEALIALEAPLNKKAQDTIDRVLPVWRRVAEFMLKVSGVVADPLSITPRFDEPSTVQPRTEAEITQIRVLSKVPLKTALAWEGRTEEEIEQMEKDQADEQKKSQTSLAEVLLSAERQFNQGPATQPANNDQESSFAI